MYQNWLQGLDRDRLGVLAGAVLLALSLGRLLDLPSRPILSARLLGSPLGLQLSAGSLLALLVLGLCVTATENLVRSHPLARGGGLDQSLVHWLAPGLFGLGLSLWLAQLENPGLWSLALLASAAPLLLLLAAEYAAVDPEIRGQGWLAWTHQAVTYLIAWLLFFLIYSSRARSLVAAPAIWVVATLLAGRLFWSQGTGRGLALLYGGLTGLLLAQLLWVINYWPLTGLRAGLLLLLAFYLVVGLLQQNLAGRFGRPVVLEYAAVAGLALLFIYLWPG